MSNNQWQNLCIKDDWWVCVSFLQALKALKNSGRSGQDLDDFDGDQPIECVGPSDSDNDSDFSSSSSSKLVSWVCCFHHLCYHKKFLTFLFFLHCFSKSSVHYCNSKKKFHQVMYTGPPSVTFLAVLKAFFIWSIICWAVFHCYLQWLLFRFFLLSLLKNFPYVVFSLLVFLQFFLPVIVMEIFRLFCFLHF